MKKDFDTIKELYGSVKSNRARNLPLWQTISSVVGIGVNPQYDATYDVKQGQQLDLLIDDPTAAISVNQAGDYIWGILWGTGDNVFNLVPSDYVLEMASKSELDKYYQFVSKRVLEDMNNPNAGLNTCAKPYCYDQVAFGTSGLGCFPNKAFDNGVEDNPFFFRNYGVDNLAIDEGKNGLVDIIFVPLRWRVNRIVSEFAMENGVLNKKIFSQLPKDIQAAYNSADYNKEFNIVHGIIPRDDFSPKYKGKRGARYRGIWFCDDNADKPFFEEDYKTLPIAVCRGIRIRGDVWGRASGTMIISTIRSVNYMVGKVIEIVEKQGSPSLGMFNNALIGDGVLDTSADGINIFNPAMASDGKNPLFPLYDVGDPSKIIQFLIPYLNEKISTAFKIDILLDFASDASKTATEMLQRSVIRGKSLAGFLQQQKCELIVPIIHRSVSIEQDKQRLGIDANVFAEEAKMLIDIGKADMIIPPAVVKCISEGKPWYKIQFNNELEKLSRTERVEALLKMLNVITFLASGNQQIIMAFDWYKIAAEAKELLCPNSDWMFSADEFKQQIAANAEMMAKERQMLMLEQASNTVKNAAGADKLAAEASRGGK